MNTLQYWNLQSKDKKKWMKKNTWRSLSLVIFSTHFDFNDPGGAVYQNNKVGSWNEQTMKEKRERELFTAAICAKCEASDCAIEATLSTKKLPSVSKREQNNYLIL